MRITELIIRSTEDVDFFDERPDLITNEENWGV